MFCFPFNAYYLCQKYTDLHHSVLEIRRFFIVYRNSKCIKEVVGVLAVARVANKVATFLKLETWFRRSSSIMFVENGDDQ